MEYKTVDMVLKQYERLLEEKGKNRSKNHAVDE